MTDDSLGARLPSNGGSLAQNTELGKRVDRARGRLHRIVWCTADN